MTIQNRHKKRLLHRFKEEAGNTWMAFRMFEGYLHPRRVSFHKTAKEAVEKAKVWSNIYGPYNVMPYQQLSTKLEFQLLMESSGIVKAVSTRFDPEAMTLQFLEKNLKQDNMRTSHLISDELFVKAMDEIQQGNRHVVYDSSRYLLDLRDMYFLRDEASAKVFAKSHAPSPENMQTFRADSLMDIYDHFVIEQSLKQHNTIDSPLKNTTMQQDNYEYLTKSLFYVGYGETLNDKLKENMMAGQKEFSLQQVSDFGKEQATAILHFRKSDTSDMYFFNSHELSLTKGNAPDWLTQKFYINHNQDNITLKEGLNMLQGRAVYKELTSSKDEKYNAWVQLDFTKHDESGNFNRKTFNEGYGFKLEEVLAKYPIMALKDEAEKKLLIESLQRGNRQSVTLEVDGKPVKAFIEAAPQFKKLNFYDQHMKEKMAHEITAKVSEGQKNNTKISDDDIDKKQSRGRRM